MSGYDLNNIGVFLDTNVVISDMIDKIQIGEIYANFNLSEVPLEGWKIHISCTLKNYKQIIKSVIPILLKGKISFKIVKDIELYRQNSLKTGDQFSYGKFITIYPASKEHFLNLLEILYPVVKEFEGPYVLSDMRYKEAKCLFYRYGSNKISDNYDEYGRRIPVIHDGDGNIIEDGKSPCFSLPNGIENPLDVVEDPSESKVLLRRYDSIKAIQFTPMGGVYRAVDKNMSKDVIIKESYPYTGLVDEEVDAIIIRKNERDNLARLACFDFVPKIASEFYDWDNYYLVIEKMKGVRFDEWVSQNTAFSFYNDSLKIKEYIIKLINIVYELTKNLNEVAKKGYYISDISPDNILIHEDKIYLLDLENVIDKDNKDNKEKLFSYTVGFGNQDKTVLENNIYALSSMLLFGLHKNNNLFDTLSPQEILKPYVMRYDDIEFVANFISNIRTLSDLEDVLKELSKMKKVVSELEFEKRNFCALNLPVSLEAVYRQCEENLMCNISVDEDPFSLVLGKGGILLCKKYMDIMVSDKELDDYFSAVENRSLGLYYGLAGQIYLSALYERENENLLTSVLSSLDQIKGDYSVKKGLSGVGIAFAFYYQKLKNPLALEGCLHIADLCMRINLNENGIFDYKDIALEKGYSGVAYFLLNVFKLTGNSSYLKKSFSIINKCLLYARFEENKTFDMLIGEHEEKSPYIKDGAMGFLCVLILAQSIKYQRKYDAYIKKILKKYEASYSLSNGYYEGSAGLLYTYLIAYRHYNEETYLNVAKWFVNDIYCSYKDGYFLQPNMNTVDSFMYGNLSVLSVLYMYQNNSVIDIFPFVY